MAVLRTPFYQELPNVFIYNDLHGTPQFGGTFAKIISLFAERKNYRLELVAGENYKISAVQKFIESQFFNLSMNGCTYGNAFANVTFSYPVEWSDVCVMVPAEDELPRYWYIIWPFGRYIWTFMGLTVLYAAWVMKYLKHPTTSFIKNLLFSLALVLYSPNTNLKWINVPLRLQWFYGLIMVMGFILSGYYGCYLTAYNMRPVFQPFMKTEKDLLQANIKILIPSTILEEFRNNEYVDLSSLEPILIDKSQQEVSNYIRKFSRSYAYMITQTDWMFVSKLQRNLIQPIYQLSEICYGSKLNTFPIQLDSKFARSLDFFILMIQQSGLWMQWEEEAFYAAIRAKYYYVPQDAYPVDRLNLRYYKIAWIIFFAGVALSTLWLIIELIINRKKLRNMKIK